LFKTINASEKHFLIVEVNQLFNSGETRKQENSEANTQTHTALLARSGSHVISKEEVLEKTRGGGGCCCCLHIRNIHHIQKWTKPLGYE